MQINYKVKKIVAMTLAEILITLGIMGTVFALTVPTVKGNTDKRRMETLLKKSYSIVNQAIDMSLAKDPEDSISKWDFSDNGKMFNRLLKHMNVQKICPANSKYCFAGSYKFISTNSTYSGYDFSAYKSAILSGDIAFQVLECNGNLCDIHVDLNGPKEPNVVGYDYFEFILHKDDKKGLTYKDNCASAHSDFCLTEKIMDNNWEINYW